MIVSILQTVGLFVLVYVGFVNVGNAYHGKPVEPANILIMALGVVAVVGKYFF